MAELLLGPILRYIAETTTTVWVETDGPCRVEILGCGADTFRVEGHHYALVIVSGLEPGTIYPYEVQLDGATRWPQVDSEFPPSVIRTPGGEGPQRVSFGSCRVALPHERPYTYNKENHPDGRGPDALFALALQIRERPPAEWPDLLLLLGDQIYADDVSPGTLEFIRERRNCEGPHGSDVADFEEFRHLYFDSWGDPPMRWLLSVLPSAMIFDDHDVHDDWNTSLKWLQRVRAEPWWNEHIVNALSSYWVYQHLGNLSPAEIEQDELFARVQKAEDGSEILRDFARRADREPATARWSYSRDLGRTRLVMIDSRASRVLEPGHRSMLDEREWKWLEECVTGDFDHLLVATSLPVLLAPGLHDLESWNEAVCDGAWGPPGRVVGEWLRERVDLEHWAAFRQSFLRLAKLLEQVASGQRGPAPASIVLLSGDVHHAYLAEVTLDPSTAPRSAVYQAVCSPLRNGLDRRERSVVRFACSRVGHILGHILAATARVPRLPITWRLVDRKPSFENQVARIELDGRAARVDFEVASANDTEPPRLVQTLGRQLA